MTTQSSAPDPPVVFLFPESLVSLFPESFPESLSPLLFPLSPLLFPLESEFEFPEF